MKTINAFLLSNAAKMVRDYRCPKCELQFDPYGRERPSSFADVFLCPRCGRKTTLAEAIKEMTAQGDIHVPESPTPRPANCRITRLPGDGDGFVYHIPPGRSWFALAFGLAWNLFVIGAAVSLFRGGFDGDFSDPRWPILTLSVFGLIGLALTYTGVRLAFLSWRLWVTPETFTLKSSALLGKARSVETRGIDKVRLAIFYTRNYTPVHGVEIGAGKRKLRFGSGLREDEKLWLASEISDYARKHGAVIPS